MLGDYNQIIPNRLWVGAGIRPEDSNQLRRMGITTVLSLQCDIELKRSRISPRKLSAALEEADIELLRIPVMDLNKADLVAKLPSCVGELEGALARGWAKVYLHCSAGVNRSPTVAAAYLMKLQKLSVKEAFDYLMKKRECAPDPEVLQRFSGQEAGMSA